MDLEPDAVAEAVGEALAVAGVLDHRTRGRVDVRAGDARTHRVDARLLRLLHDLVDLLAAPQAGSPNATVRVMSAWYPSHSAPEVELDDVALLEHAVVPARGAARPRSRRTRRSGRTPSRRRRPGASRARAGRATSRSVMPDREPLQDVVEREVGDLLGARSAASSSSSLIQRWRSDRVLGRRRARGPRGPRRACRGRPRSRRAPRTRAA